MVRRLLPAVARAFYHTGALTRSRTSYSSPRPSAGRKSRATWEKSNDQFGAYRPDAGSSRAIVIPGY